MFAFTIFLFSTLSLLAFSSPLTLRDVWNPPITSPNEKTVWKVGDKVTVTSDVSNMPPVSQLTQSTGTVLLGFLNGKGENLMIDSPLATGFNLTDAQVQFTVPSVTTRNNYIVVVLGDSGNASPQFTIQSVGSASSVSTVGMAPIPTNGTTPTPSPSKSTSDPSSKSTSTSTTPAASTPVTTSSSSQSSAWKRFSPLTAYSLVAAVLVLVGGF